MLKTLIMWIMTNCGKLLKRWEHQTTLPASWEICTQVKKQQLDGNDNPICKTEKETQMYRTDFWTLWEKVRVGCFDRTASKHVYYLGWNRSPAQVGCMRQVLRPGALGRPRGSGWRGRWEGGSGWGIHVYPRLIHFNVWQKPLQYCKVISLQLIKKKQTWNNELVSNWERSTSRLYVVTLLI